MLFYTLLSEKGEISFSPCPRVDNLYAGSQLTTNLGIPLSLLESWFRGIPEQAALRNSDRKESMEKEVLKKITFELKRVEKFFPEPLRWQQIKWDLGDEDDWIPILSNEKLFSQMLEKTEGRQLTEGEYALLSKSLGIRDKVLILLLHKAVLRGLGEWVPAIRLKKGKWHCERCGSSDVQEWPSAYGNAATCQACESIGALTSQQSIFRMEQGAENSTAGDNGKLEEKSDTDLTMMPEEYDSFRYSKAQKQAADLLLDLDKKSGAEELLVWAACGAGKTEICFPLIRRYLQRRKKVLFAAPRQDVVHDIQPRLQRSFPEVNVKILSGAVGRDFEQSLLTVATTHQVLRYYKAFDLILFDEMDAYPYAGSKFLEFGMRQAIGEKGRLIYLTATPSEEMLHGISAGTCACVRLPARHHGKPLPEPEWVKMKLPDHQILSSQPSVVNKYLDKLIIILKDFSQNGPLLIFVPTVSMVQHWMKALSAIFQGIHVTGSWAADPERRKKVRAFLAGNIDIFICTSILERGVTVNAVQVVILYADHDLYDVRSLVQMAGRTGRTAQCPAGRAAFIAPKSSKAMVQAAAWIKEQNDLAKEGGFLDA